MGRQSQKIKIKGCCHVWGEPRELVGRSGTHRRPSNSFHTELVHEFMLRHYRAHVAHCHAPTLRSVSKARSNSAVRGGTPNWHICAGGRATGDVCIHGGSCSWPGRLGCFSSEPLEVELSASLSPSESLSQCRFLASHSARKRSFVNSGDSDSELWSNMKPKFSARSGSRAAS